jgi:alpha-L-fucosidase
VVLKITNAEPGLDPPIVITSGAKWDAGRRTVVFSGELKKLGDASSVEAGFQYRRKKITAEMYEPDYPWIGVKPQTRASAGTFSATAAKLQPGLEYEYRAFVKHPVLTLHGAEKSFAATK